MDPKTIFCDDFGCAIMRNDDDEFVDTQCKKLDGDGRKGSIKVFLSQYMLCRPISLSRGYVDEE